MARDTQPVHTRTQRLPLNRPKVSPLPGSDGIPETQSSRRPLWLGIGLALLATGGFVSYRMLGSNPSAGASSAASTTSTAETAAASDAAAEKAALSAKVQAMEQRMAEMEAARQAEIDSAVAAAKQEAEVKAKAEKQNRVAGAPETSALEVPRVPAPESTRIGPEKSMASAARNSSRETESARGPTSAPVALPARVADAVPPSQASTPFPQNVEALITPLPTVENAATAPERVVAKAATTPPALLDPNAPGVSKPVLLSESSLRYPEKARALKISGSVVVSALIDESGRVADARLVRKEAGDTGFNEAALEHVRSRRYRPAMQDGRPGPTWMAIRVEFKL